MFADDGNIGTIVTDIIYPNSCNPLVLEPGMIKDNTTKLDLFCTKFNLFY